MLNLMEGVYEQACIQEKVKSIFCFHHLNNSELQAIADIFSIQKFKAGDIIFKQGQKAVSFFIVLSRNIQLYKIDGKKIILCLLAANEVFAEVASFSDLSTHLLNSLYMEDN
jgi:CRP-like cAMP-binding protein